MTQAYVLLGRSIALCSMYISKGCNVRQGLGKWGNLIKLQKSESARSFGGLRMELVSPVVLFCTLLIWMIWRLAWSCSGSNHKVSPPVRQTANHSFTKHLPNICCVPGTAKEQTGIELDLPRQEVQFYLLKFILWSLDWLFILRPLTPWFPSGLAIEVTPFPPWSYSSVLTHPLLTTSLLEPASIFCRTCIHHFPTRLPLSSIPQS